ncbi:multiprotein-bridging factor 1 family protein [Pseudomonas sp. Pseusp122]|uniref:helix-turn-helix domain-containing protein n=1 Tax=unclassified Pseudomonas TaxID=196821 RepID=UPI0039A6EC6C
MTKAIYRREHVIFLQVLKRMRVESGMTQAQCSAALGRPQSFMSDVERGVRRLDTVQLRDLCKVLDSDLVSFTNAFEQALGNLDPSSAEPSF